MKTLITSVVAMLALGACSSGSEVESSGHEFTNPSYSDPAATMEWMWDTKMTDQEQVYLCNDYLTSEYDTVVQIIMDTYPADKVAAQELYKILNEECG